MNKMFMFLIMGLIGVVVLAWTAISLFDTVATVDVTPGVPSQLAPIDDKFDSAIITDIEARTGELPVPPSDLLKIEAETLKRIEELKSSDQ